MSILVLMVLFSSFSFADLPEGRIISPYESCKNVVIVNEDKYKKNQTAWDDVSKTCNVKLQLAQDVAITSINPLAESAKYLNVAHQVTKKVLENLEKSRKYADCSSVCFSGAASCIAELSEDNKIVQCDTRKKEITEFLKVTSRKIKMELALSTGAPGVLNVNIRNVLNVKPEQFINSDLHDIDLLTPNPVGRIDLTERELKEAKRRSLLDRSKLEEEFKSKGYKNYSDWMSTKLMQNFDEHAEKYRGLIYEEAPIFSVIEKPESVDSSGEPKWNDRQIAQAFKNLSKNADSSKEKVKYSLRESKIEFNRWTGDALVKGAISMLPNTMERNDLLFYMGMSNQVEAVLKEDPSMCAAATEMIKRLKSKEDQNTVASLGFTISTSLGGKAVKGIFKIGRALTVLEASGITGLALGANSLHSMSKYNNVAEEAATLSGIGEDKEGIGLRRANEVSAAKENMTTSLILVPAATVGSWTVGKVLYKALAKQMEKDLPAISKLARKAKISSNARDQLVDRWLNDKMMKAYKSGNLSEADKVALSSSNANKILEELIAKIEKSNPDFFNDPKNLNFFLKAAATNLKKLPNDPTNLGSKAEYLIQKLNASALKGSINPRAEQGLLKIYDNVIDELREANRYDPAAFAKFGSDPQSEAKIINNALTKAGVTSADDARAMRQCIMK